METRPRVASCRQSPARHRIPIAWLLIAPLIEDRDPRRIAEARATAQAMGVFLSDLATRRYMRGRDLAILVAVALFESFGYRQVNSLWGCLGTVQAITGRGGWGPMKRRAFQA